MTEADLRGLHLGLADLVVPGVESQLVDLGRELLHVLADELDQGAARLAGRLHAMAGELLADPPTLLCQRALAELLASVRDAGLHGANERDRAAAS